MVSTEGVNSVKNYYKGWEDLYRNSYYSNGFGSSVVSSEGVIPKEVTRDSSSKLVDVSDKVNKVNRDLLILDKYSSILRTESLRGLDKYKGHISKQDLDVLKHYKAGIETANEKSELLKNNEKIRKTKNKKFSFFRR